MTEWGETESLFALDGRVAVVTGGASGIGAGKAILVKARTAISSRPWNTPPCSRGISLYRAAGTTASQPLTCTSLPKSIAGALGEGRRGTP